MWFIGVEVEQETSVARPKKNPGSAPVNSDDFGGHLVLRIEDQERNIRTKDRYV